MANRNLNTPQDVAAAALTEGMGGCGATYVAASSTVTGEFVAFTVIASSGAITTVGSPTLATTVPAGVTIFGRMTSITTAAGTTLIAYTSCR